MLASVLVKQETLGYVKEFTLRENPIYECKLSENRLLKVPSKHHLLPIKRHLRAFGSEKLPNVWAIYHKLPLISPPPPPPSKPPWINHHHHHHSSLLFIHGKYIRQ